MLEDKILLYQEKMDALLSLSSDGILFTDNMKIVEANKSLEKMLEVSRSELLGKNIRSFVVKDSFKKKTFDKKGYSFTASLKKKDGTILNADLYVRSLNNSDKRCNIIIIKLIDVENQILNAIFEAEERERLHFSSEIHDGLGPAITVLQIYFQWLADSSEENRAFIIEKGNYYFNEVGNILKEIILRHNPSIVENNGISYAINIFISKLNATNKINILFESNFTVRFGLKLEVAIYRIVTELINNTMKYAKATEIVIKLDYDESVQNINLLYTDNGQGMKFENLSCNNLNSFGILYIKSRVRALNGSFHFSNCEQRGVKIEISLPVKN